MSSRRSIVRRTAVEKASVARSFVRPSTSAKEMGSSQSSPVKKSGPIVLNNSF